MNRFRALAIVTIFGLASFPGAGRADSKMSRADFSGTWALNEGKSQDPFAKLRGDAVQAGEGDGTKGGGSRGRGGRGGGGSSGARSTGEEPPSELMEDERRIVVTDDGEKVKIIHGQGRQRVLFLDGDERELDDGDGPAKVKARRKGNTISVSIKSRDRDLHETWELLSDPRRIFVTTKVSGRTSFTYKRVYEPAPERQAEAATASAPTAVPVPTAAADVAPVVPAPGAPRPECSIRPPRGTRPEDLSRMARITQRDAEKRAAAAIAPRRASSVMTSDVEVDDGCLVWSFDLRFDGTSGFQEVIIDAGDGKILSSRYDDGKPH
jgi:hypothetical protein